MSLQKCTIICMKSSDQRPLCHAQQHRQHRNAKIKLIKSSKFSESEEGCNPSIKKAQPASVSAADTRRTHWELESRILTAFTKLLDEAYIVLLIAFSYCRHHSHSDEGFIMKLVRQLAG